MRRITVLLAVTLTGAGLATVTTAASSPPLGSATVLIRHQVAHCHAWSVNGGPFGATQHLSLQRGGTITFMNTDVMPHRLIQLAGARVAMRNGTTMPMGARMHGPVAPGAMNHMAATTSITLARPGVYRFRTRAGEDYMAGIKTTGEDNVLTLTVTVQ